MVPRMMRVGVTGVGGQAGVVAVKTLSNEKKLYVVGMDSNPLSAGFAFCKTRYIVPLAEDHSFVNHLLEICSKERLDVLIPTVDEELIPLSESKNEFEERGTKLSVSDRESLLKALDKYRLYELLSCSGVPVPKTYLAKEIKLDDLCYPVVIKPRIGRGSRDVSICKCAEELSSAIQRVDNAIVQEYLPGDEYTIDTLSDLEGKPLVAVPRKRIEIKAGISWKGMVVDDERLTRIALKAIELLKIKGPACLQVKLNSMGLPEVIDVNPRIGGGTSLTVKAGVNIPLLAVKLMLGIRPKEYELKFRKVAFARYFEDVFFD
jgi:carbamoyl-phosphate synthase large subunit